MHSLRRSVVRSATAIALADGAVRFVGEGTSVQVLGQLATRAGGESVSLD